MEFKHYSVMADETLEGLCVKPDGIYIDCTLGGCGHTKRILSLLGENGRVIGIDLDNDALANARETVNDPRLLLWHGNFKEMRTAAKEYGYEKVDGVLFDLGVSSYQIDTASRGFSYIRDAKLDMRFDTTQGDTAEDVVNSLSEYELADIFYRYGEERYSRKIASRIVEYRETKQIETTSELASIIASACPASYKKEGNPAKRCFQALRIFVNGELDDLGKAFETAADMLNGGGRLAIITFHSLEDRIAKTTLTKLENPCECPKDFPVCVCGKKPIVKVITKKAITSSDKENEENSRSHSAKLRIAEKL